LAVLADAFQTYYHFHLKFIFRRSQPRRISCLSKFRWRSKKRWHLSACRLQAPAL